MKNLFKFSLSLGLALTFFSENKAQASQICHSETLKRQIQAIYDVKTKNIPFGKRKVLRLDFVTPLKSQQFVNVFAGADDRNIKNNLNFDVEVYKMIAETFLETEFKAVIVDQRTCNVIETLLIDSHRKD